MLCLLGTPCLNFAYSTMARYSSNTYCECFISGVNLGLKIFHIGAGGREPRFFALLQIETLDSLILRLSE